MGHPECRREGLPAQGRPTHPGQAPLGLGEQGTEGWSHWALDWQDRAEAGAQWVQQA